MTFFLPSVTRGAAVFSASPLLASSAAARRQRHTHPELQILGLQQQLVLEHGLDLLLRVRRGSAGPPRPVDVPGIAVESDPVGQRGGLTLDRCFLARRQQERSRYSWQRRTPRLQNVTIQEAQEPNQEPGSVLILKPSNRTRNL